jgi:hypothetical protein
MKPPTSEAERDAAEALALRALAFLAEDPERLGRFLALCGIGPSELRSRAADPALLGGVLDHLLGDERLLIAFAERHEIEPEATARARRHLPGVMHWD